MTVIAVRTEPAVMIGSVRPGTNRLCCLLLADFSTALDSPPPARDDDLDGVE